MNTEEAILHLRSRPECHALMRDAYLDADLQMASRRFSRSAEFAETLLRIRRWREPRTVVDVGAGTGIASHAFRHAGVDSVIAVEPDPSHEIGQGAIRRLGDGVKVIGAVGESIPIADCTVDVVYARQVLHHASELRRFVKECGRILVPGGVFFAAREHVVDDDNQLEAFLKAHPVHSLAGGENAYPLDCYLAAIHGAGLDVREVLGPFESVISGFPGVRDSQEFKQWPRIALMRKLGRVGFALSLLPLLDHLVGFHIRRPSAGRLYTFLATKPS